MDSDKEAKYQDVSHTFSNSHSIHHGEITDDSHHQLKRNLGNRQIQLIAIGGAIGTASFISISTGLVKGGPASLLIAYAFYSAVMCLVNNCMAEMAVYMPVAGAFLRMAGKWVDEAFGFMAGWNFFFYEAVLIPFEISALNLVLTYWRDDIPVEAVVATCIVLYFTINVVAVSWYGEAEFFLASGKILLILIVYCFTFVTMVGGNPKHDAYGFRYWYSPGAFAENITTGSLGKFEGFLGALWSAAFTIVGPEYVTMVAGETKLPRTYLKAAFKSMYARIIFFFVGSALCVGIVVPYNDSTLLAILNGESGGAGTAAASPYVIAMANLGVEVLPHITNALLVTSIFSAGNAYTYCASRSIYGLALDGHAPKIFGYCTKAGVPIYALCVTMIFPCLAFLNISSNSAQVLTWLVNLITAAQIIDYIVICITFLAFYRACKAQNIDRRTLPYYGYFQPYSAWIGLIFMTAVVCVYGYSVFLPGKWEVSTFFTYYTMLLVAPILYFGWKIFKGTKIIRPEDVDLVWQKPAIDAYEAGFEEEVVSFWTDIARIAGFRKSRVSDESEDN
ncbi:amino acid permease/ SLC12A domain-containing protein [Camillea tinctor]|nr:amino acid permease/ SLC12A domain-containing protein [Camillea tinctor]